MKIRKSGILFLALAMALQLAALGAFIAVATFTGSKGGPPRNYMFLLDTSKIKNLQNSTGLPDGTDGDKLKDFYAVYMTNYCSGKIYEGIYTISFCSKSGQVFDYTDDNWEDYGVDLLNVTGTVPHKRLVKRKGGGGGGHGGGGGGGKGGGGGGKSSGSKSSGKTSSGAKPSGGTVKSAASTARTQKAKAMSRTGTARPVYAVTFGPTYHFRIFWLVVSFAIAAAMFAIFAIFWYWCAIVAGIFCLMATFTSIALAVDPKDSYKKFGNFLKTYKGPNGSSINLKAGTTPFLIIWVAFAMLMVSSICWVVCFFLLLRKPKPKTTRLSNEFKTKDLSQEDLKGDINANGVQKNSVLAKMKKLVGGKKAKETQYVPIGGSQQHDTSYTSPNAAMYDVAPPMYSEQKFPQTAYEPMRT